MRPVVPAAMPEVRRKYRLLRKAGLSAHDARGIVYDLLFDGRHLFTYARTEVDA
jgi:hypothetical protein